MQTTEHNENTVRLILADDHQLFREGLKRIINLEDDLEVVAECSDGQKALEACLKIAPDVILMDINMPKLNGVEATQQIKELCPNTRIIILSIHDDESYVFEALRQGASGYLLKDMEADLLIEAIRLVSKGQAYIHPQVTGKLIDELKRLSIQEAHFSEMNGILREEKEEYFDLPDQSWRDLLTRREVEVLQLMTEGRSNRMIGEALFISEKTVKNHVSSILQKMEVNDRTQAVITAIKNGWVSL